MKIQVLFLLLFVIPKFSFSQDIQVNASNSFLLNSSIRANITSASKVGFGFRVSAGYKISEHFAALLSSGYMTSHADAKQNVNQRYLDPVSGDYIVTQSFAGERIFQMIPIDLSLLYNFSLFGVEPYAIVKAGGDFIFNNNDYDLTIETKNESTGEILESESGTPNSIYGAPNDGGSFTFGLGFGGGVLIPIANNFDLDISYLYSENSASPTINSFGVGINLGF
jgi:opacity protein-like surface antigen